LRLLKQFVVDYLIGVALVALICLLSIFSHGAVGKQHVNSIGTPMYMDNPFTYKAGAIIAVAYVANGKGLAVRVQPIGTYGLFTEDILFCGTPTESFLNMTNPMVLTYRTRANKMIDYVGCHDLISVYSLKPKEKLQ